MQSPWMLECFSDCFARYSGKSISFSVQSMALIAGEFPFYIYFIVILGDFLKCFFQFFSATARNAFPAASTVLSTSSSVCAPDRNRVSNWEGAR